MTDRLVVYTALFGEGDALREPTFPEQDIDYICFSDRERDSRVFKTRIIESSMDPRVQAKEIKLLPHKYLPNHSVSLWMDASMSLLIQQMDGFVSRNLTTPLTLFRSDRKTVAEEVEFCIKTGKADPMELQRQLDVYLSRGFPDSDGLFKGGFLLRRHNEPNLIHFNEDWWGENLRHTTRDEVSFPYISWLHHWQEGRDFSVFPFDVNNNPLMRINKHLNRQ